MLLAILWIFILLPIGVGTPGRVNITVIAPYFWPSICGLVLMALGVAITVRAWWYEGQKDQGKMTKINNSQDIILPIREGLPRIGGASAIIIFYYLMIGILGMPLASGLAFLTLSLLAGERRFLLIASVALMLPVVLFVFFSRIANVPIPLGITDTLI